MTIVVLSLTVSLGAASAATGVDEMLERIRTVYQVVAAYHKDGADLDKFTAGAIKGGLEALGDPHTNYYTASEYTDFLNSLNGQFSGIGAYLEQDGDYITITSPIKGSPAFRAGLLTGDRILEVDGESMVGVGSDVAVSKIRGAAGTSVKLKIERPSQRLTFTITLVRENISIPEVESKMLENGVGYLQLNSFGDDSVRLFYQAVESLKQEGAKGLILDIRQNGGGYLSAGVDIASAFVPKGETVVIEVGQAGQQSVTSSGRLINLPTVVLVDGGSASAAEILAGAIQDHGAAPLVGTTTYGKGTVQQILTLTAGGGMKVTVAEYLTPKERHVHGIGLTPDYVVEKPVPDAERVGPLELDRPLYPSSAGLDVLRLQYRLQDLGYTVETTGFLGMNTVEAINTFAHNRNLPPDYVGEEFVKALNKEVASKSKGNTAADVQLEKAVELLRAKLGH
jgi:carboxyl-terminal processing protease